VEDHDAQTSFILTFVPMMMMMMMINIIWESFYVAFYSTNPGKRIEGMIECKR